MEKAIEIKRRAQRCIQNGDLDGALNEYEKLVGTDDSDPYNYVLLADLLYKKGDQAGASERYLAAVSAYEKASLYKNAIAVCKKMLRLTLSPAKVLHALGNLHALDGLAGEAALYYVQYAEHMVRSSAPADAAVALRQAFDVCQDNIRVLEQLSEAWMLAGEPGKAAQALVEAATWYKERGADMEARRCTERAHSIDPSVGGAGEPEAPTELHAPEAAPEPAAPAKAPAVARASAPPQVPQAMPVHGERELSHREAPAAAPPAADNDLLHGFETGRHGPGRPASPAESTLSAPEPVVESPAPEPVVEAPEPEFEAADEAPEPEAELEASVDAVAEEPAAEGDEVYEIGEEELIPFEQAAPAAPPAAVIPPSPAPAPAAAYPAAPGLAEPARVEEPAASEEALAIAGVERLLAAAQEQFRGGDRDEASHTLMRAAQAYEALGRADSAATIYRSLGRGAHATPEMLELWLGNCELRNDMHEAAQVACELGDRALNDGDENMARDWFTRALSFDLSNETAHRRIRRLSQSGAPAAGAPPVAVATTPTAPPPPPVASHAAPVAPPPPPAAEPPAESRVEVAVGRAEAVSFDLAGLLAEFQRGVESQLAGDAQSNYDLAMTYREMGLFDQAMESFRAAGQDPEFAVRASEMVARCLADQGRHGDAVAEFARALGLPGVGPENDAELRFHFGNALAETGRLDEALQEYELVARHLPGYEDVDARIEALRRTLGRA